MPEYVMLMKLTEQGARNIDESPARIAAAKAIWERLCGTVKSFHVTFGEYDYVAIGEAPNDWSAAAFAATLAAAGDVTTCTLKALTEDDWSWVLGASTDALCRGDRSAPIVSRTSKKTLLPKPVQEA